MTFMNNLFDKRYTMEQKIEFDFLIDHVDI
jgi:hypothetical protein